MTDEVLRENATAARGWRKWFAARDPARESVSADPYGTQAPAEAQGLLAVYNLGKSYGGRAVVEDVSLAVRRGEAVGLLGPNGAGKTTVFYMITGLVQAGQGRHRARRTTSSPACRCTSARASASAICRRKPRSSAASTSRTTFAPCSRSPSPIATRARRRSNSLLEEFDIARLRKTPSIALSGGERRRCEIARALAGKPSFMLLDEPFAGIDPIAVGDIQDLVRHLKGRGIGVLITDHNVRETLGLIDRAYIIHSGHVLTEGPPDAIVAHPDVRRFYLGEDFRM